METLVQLSKAKGKVALSPSITPTVLKWLVQ